MYTSQMHLFVGVATQKYKGQSCQQEIVFIAIVLRLCLPSRQYATRNLYATVCVALYPPVSLSLSVWICRWLILKAKQNHSIPEATKANTEYVCILCHMKFIWQHGNGFSIAHGYTFNFIFIRATLVHLVFCCACRMSTVSVVHWIASDSDFSGIFFSVFCFVSIFK